MKGYAPGLLGRAITDIPEIRTAINSIAERVASVPWAHVRVTADGSYKPLAGPIHNALTLRPNPMNTPQSNMTLIVTRMLLYNNAYVMPEWDESGNLKWLWPLPFSSHEVVNKDGAVYLRFMGIAGGYEFPWQDIIHLQRFPNGKGGIGTQATSNYETILNAIEQQAVVDAANSNKLSLLLQPTKKIKSETAKLELQKFKEDYLTIENTTGWGVLPDDYNVIKDIAPKNVPLNVPMLQTIVGALYTYFGTSPQIVNMAAGEQEFIQYVDGTIKPIVYQMEQEFTYKLCSPLEIAKGQRIQANLIDLEIANTRDKTQFLKEMTFAGMISPNEGRLLMGLPRGGKELDRIQQSKNFTTLEPGNYQVKGGESKDNGTDDTTKENGA